jgi:hypothetical protein
VVAAFSGEEAAADGEGHPEKWKQSRPNSRDQHTGLPVGQRQPTRLLVGFDGVEDLPLGAPVVQPGA